MPFRRFIITGAPGTGKTTLLQALAEAGELCYPEVSRILIQEQSATGGSLFPWNDLAGFAEQCTIRMRAQLEQNDFRHRAFFDRGLPDVIAYLRHGNQPPPPELINEARAYTPLAFFLPPWREIYTNDPERPQAYREAVELSGCIREAYLECGFELVELERASVSDRLHSVLARLDRAPL